MCCVTQQVETDQETSEKGMHVPFIIHFGVMPKNEESLYVKLFLSLSQTFHYLCT